MMKYIILILSISLLSCQNQNRKKDQVRVTIEITGVPDSSRAYITGNTEALGLWQPGEVMMNRVGVVHQYDIWKNPGEKVEFKITLGTWETEGRLNDDLAAPNIAVSALEDTLVYIHIHRWDKPEVESTVSGELEIWTMDDPNDMFAGRAIRIWKPEHIDSTTRILYMMDGQNLFDVATSNPAGEWGIDEYFSDNPTHAPIVVGVDNSIHRSIEYVDSDTGQAFRHWVVNTVIDSVEKTFPNALGKEGRIMAGSSAGGTITTLFMIDYPEVFGQAICFSPAYELHWKTYDLDIISKFKEAELEPIPLYLTMSLRDIDTVLVPGYFTMLNQLEEKGWEEDVTYFSVIDSVGTHNEPSWNALWPGAWEWMSREWE